MHEIISTGYSVFFNENGYDALKNHLSGKRYSSIFIITDENTSNHCLPQFLGLLSTDVPIEIIEIESGESMKNISTCVEIWNTLTDLGADRKSLVINLGGGVISDLGGFIASTFKRGIGFINIPTTLLGMVDASIGGKNGVDLGNLKNQIGTINAPEMVLIDTQYLQTLPANEMRSGLAEMFKHGLIADKNYWEALQHVSEIDYSQLDLLIHGSVLIKNEIVMEDPTENGIRKALNFGHTLGHAIESHFLNLGNGILHGEAIAVGMILESFISMKKGFLNTIDYLTVKKTIKNSFPDITFSENDVTSILALMVHDKKNEYGTVMFALIDGIGKIVIDQNAENDLIVQAFEDYKL